MGFWLTGVAQFLLTVQTATVVGVVRDAESGMPLAEAIVSLTDLDRHVLTDGDGRYVLDALPGPQRVKVHRLGYTAQTLEAIVPRQGTLEIDVQLRREPIILPPIEVRSRVPIRGVEPGAYSHLAFPDRSLSQGDLYHHPNLAEPDPLRAIGGGEVVMNSESPSGIHIRGGAPDQVSYLLDGIPVFSPYHTGGTFGAWNPDALSGVDLITSMPAPTAPEALSGVVSASTRAPGERFHTRGSVSATQARATFDGPLGRGGAGYLVSAGSAFPGLVAHKQEASHINGENFDWLGKVESPLAGGRLRLVGYGSQNEIDAAAVVESDTTAADPTRNALAWKSRSLGGEWRRALGRSSFLLRAWSAFGNADAAWVGPDSLERLTADRRDEGGVAQFELDAGGGTTTTGVRAERSETSYRLRPTSPDARELSLGAATPLTTVFLGHERPVTTRGEVDVMLSGAFVGGDEYLSPGVQFRWRPARTLLLSGTAARRHQFGQSLRNAESVVSNIFPADLFVGTGDSGVPVARSDIGILALEHRPNAWLRLGAQGFIRDFDGLALVAPMSAGPFASDGFAVGRGEAYGFSLEAGASGERYGLLASYGYQHVRLSYGDGAYVPDYGVAHSIEAGVILFPGPATSVRIGFQGAFGRRTTAALGSLEWEACNLLDQGCEFAGSPYAWAGPLGGAALPAYYRLDLGVRRQWRVKVGEREGRLGVFGTATNLLFRKNVLTVAVDPSTGQSSAVDMRPPSPLVVGVDWRF